MTGIYCIQNMVNRKVYIGSAVNINKRWNTHLRHLRIGKHHSITLQRAWNKYHEDVFIFMILENVEDKNNLILREQYYIDKYNAYRNGYNICPVAGSRLGTKLTPEHIAKSAAAHRGTKASDETRAKMSQAGKNKVFSEEHKANISAAKKGKKVSEETRLKLATLQLGRKQSPETIAKRMEKVRGKKRSAAFCARMSALKKGTHPTDEARANMSLAHIGQAPWNKGLKTGRRLAA